MIPHFASKLAQNIDNTSNIGLWFDRFYAYKNGACDVKDNKDQKRPFLEVVSECCNVDQAQLDRHLMRQYHLITALKGEVTACESDWHWVTGMGNNHPVENGFTFHHNLGLPYLPASAVKGLTRAWFTTEDVQPNETLTRWFGPDVKGSEDKAQAGKVIFFDALPMVKAQKATMFNGRPIYQPGETIELVEDVMTPHTGPWAENGGDGTVAPADYYDPNPVSFLVCKQLTLMFGIAPLSPSAVSKTELLAIKNGLIDALQFYGAGSKTAAGYGTMTTAPAKLERLANDFRDRLKIQNQKPLSANEAEIERLQKQLNERITIPNEQIVQVIRNAVDWSEGERRQLVAVIRSDNCKFLKGKTKKAADRRQLKEREAMVNNLDPDFSQAAT